MGGQKTIQKKKNEERGKGYIYIYNNNKNMFLMIFLEGGSEKLQITFL